MDHSSLTWKLVHPSWCHRSQLPHRLGVFPQSHTWNFVFNFYYWYPKRFTDPKIIVRIINFFLFWFWMVCYRKCQTSVCFKNFWWNAKRWGFVWWQKYHTHYTTSFDCDNKVSYISRLPPFSMWTVRFSYRVIPSARENWPRLQLPRMKATLSNNHNSIKKGGRIRLHCIVN